MALIERNSTLLNDAGDDSRFRCAGANRANAAIAAFRDLVNLRTHRRGGEKCIAAAVHWRAAGMRGLPTECDGVSFDPESSEHCSEWKTQIEQYRSLFDVQFDVGRSVL